MHANLLCIVILRGLVLYSTLNSFIDMRTQLRCKTLSCLPLCPIVHNISGQVFMTHSVLPSYEKVSVAVCSRKNFGKNRCMYTLVGNVIFESGKKHMFFKGVRSVAAMQRMVQRATHGTIDIMRVSMLVSTMQLNRSFRVQVGCQLECELLRELGSDVVILPRTEEESNAFIFKIKAWDKLTTNSDVIDDMQNMTAIISISRFGNCTLRVSTERVHTVKTWQHALAVIHEALHCISRFMCTRGLAAVVV
jgi:hypothetical protein